MLQFNWVKWSKAKSGLFNGHLEIANDLHELKKNERL